MSFPAFLRELGLLIQDRAVISCVYPRLVAIDTVNELAGMNHAHPGLATSRGSDVREHLARYPGPALLFVSEHLEDESGPRLIRDLHKHNSEHRSILILTDHHSQNRKTLEDESIAAVVIDHNIGGPTCVLTKALRAVNRNERFIDPSVEISPNPIQQERLSDRELEVLSLVADGLSNREVGEQLHLAATTVRDHMQSVMRKLNVRSRTGAAVAGLRQGLLIA